MASQGVRVYTTFNESLQLESTDRGALKKLTESDGVNFSNNQVLVSVSGLEKKATINRIEELTLQLIEDINENKFPKLIYSNQIRAADDEPLTAKAAACQDLDKQLAETAGNSSEPLSNSPASSIDTSKSLSWVQDEENEVEDDDLQLAGEETVEEKNDDLREVSEKLRTVDFRRRQSRRKLVLILTVMSHVHKMLINRTSKTRRSLYYELQNQVTANLAPTQRYLDDAVNQVANILDRAPWELGLTATSKGLVCGNLSFKFSEREPMVSCGIPGGVLIPQNINKITFVRTSARFVLVVEKDAVFQKLLEENCLQHLNCILITGKGYPDVNTRMLVSILGNKLDIPVYVLVDADPFGFEIMCIYRFGSAARSREVGDLSCPCAKWLGVHPSEFVALGISPQALTAADKGKLSSLESRRYVDEKLLEQLKLMRKGKVEIEAVARLSSYKFLTNVYLSHKIAAGEYL